MGYSLPATTLSKEECRYIMAPVYKSGLSRAGIPHTIPSAIRHGPINMGGLGLMDPYLHMGAQQVEYFMTNTWLQTPTGNLMEIAMDDIMLEMGIRSPLASHHVLKKGLAYTSTPSWIRHLLLFMVEHGITFEPDTAVLLPKRVNDATIMETAMTAISHIPTLKSINKVRMKLKVIWLSDIATADGRGIDKRFLKSGNILTSNLYHWPLKHNISTLDWQRWTHWIKGICRNNNWTLTATLGPWTIPQHQWKSTWDCLVTKDRQLLYIHTEDGTTWKRHVKQPTRNRRAPRFYKEFLIHQDISESTHELERASYSVTPTYIYLLSTSGDANWEQDVTVTTATAFYNTPFLPSRDNIIDRLQTILCPDFLQVTDNIDQLLQDFTAGSTVSVSDGSYYPDQGKAAAAWIIKSSCRTQWIIGAITVPGDSTQFNSYRSELTGLLGISITLQLLATCTPQPRHCIIGCDGKAALKSLTTNKDD